MVELADTRPAGRGGRRGNVSCRSGSQAVRVRDEKADGSNLYAGSNPAPATI